MTSITAPKTVLHDNAHLPDSSIVNVDLSDCDFNDVNLQRAVFDNVALTGARFHNVNLSDVTIENANLNGMTINGTPVTDLFAAWHAQQDKSGHRVNLAPATNAH